MLKIHTFFMINIHFLLALLFIYHRTCFTVNLLLESHCEFACQNGNITNLNLKKNYQRAHE